MTTRHAGPGRVRWIAVRPARRAPMTLRECVDVLPQGLVGDHRMREGKRAVTLVQWEHLCVIASLLGRAEIGPELLRRNIAVAGINLLALRHRVIEIGTAKLRVTGPCAPCSRMEEALGSGGYNAVRGHGGVTAEVVSAGVITIGDAVALAVP
ncbi:MAG: hypothetical protein GC150_07050 [Rhizobiales bacterium]|nr:hypothetical protein [Hyphomicrobiales bacterium]